MDPKFTHYARVSTKDAYGISAHVLTVVKHEEGAAEVITRYMFREWSDQDYTISGHRRRTLKSSETQRAVEIEKDAGASEMAFNDVLGLLGLSALGDEEQQEVV